MSSVSHYLPACSAPSQIHPRAQNLTPKRGTSVIQSFCAPADVTLSLSGRMPAD